MTIEENKIHCCGCGTCSLICPKQAINMIKDEKGFFYPIINKSICIDCGQCVSKCAFLKHSNNKNTISEVYALQHKSKDVLRHSSSGAAFTAFSDIILDEDGCVYGADFEQDFSVVHKCATSMAERDSFRESKYVQSIAFCVFREIKCNLENGKKVLFTGTPCQCAALISFLGKRPDNLIIIDLLCHGVPSNRILQDHIHLWERRTGKMAIKYHYRSKRYGYEHTHEIEFNDGSSNHSIELKRILKLYALSMRPSCYECPYSNRNRIGDLTIGDLWEAASVAAIYDHKGVSTVLVNTETGRALLREAKSSCLIFPVQIDLDEVGALNHPVKHTPKVELFWSTYLDDGYEAALNQFGAQTIKSSIYQGILRTIHTLHIDSIVERIKR